MVQLTGNPQDDQVSYLIDYLKWSKRCCAEATTTLRRSVLGRAEVELPYGLDEANAEEISQWLYRPQWSDNTLGTYRAVLDAYFAWACDPRNPRLDFNPMAYLPPPPRRPRGVARPVTDDALARILTESIQPYRTWALIAAYQGLRCCEISGLDREHVTEARLLVARGKGGAARWHDTDPQVWAAVQDLPPGPVARTRAGERASRFYVSNRARIYFRDRLSLPVTLHQLRHWLGVTVQREYKDPRVTQRVLGHASLSSTQIYTDATDEQQRAARATLPRFGLASAA